MIKIGITIMTLVSFLNAGWLSNLFDSTPTPPIEIPIDLSKAKSVVETDVRVKERGAYYFSLEFIYTDEVKNGIRDSKIARKIAGCNAYFPDTGEQSRFCDYEQSKKDLGDLIIDNNYSLDGTIIPIRLIFSQIEKNGTKSTIKDKIYQTKGAGSNMDREFEKLILEKGKYSIRVENIQAISEMKNRNADFRFARHGHK